MHERRECTLTRNASLGVQAARCVEHAEHVLGGQHVVVELAVVAGGGAAQHGQPGGHDRQRPRSGQERLDAVGVDVHRCRPYGLAAPR